jgi:hypothetical protein
MTHLIEVRGMWRTLAWLGYRTGKGSTCPKAP